MKCLLPVFPEMRTNFPVFPILHKFQRAGMSRTRDVEIEDDYVSEEILQLTRIECELVLMRSNLKFSMAQQDEIRFYCRLLSVLMD